MDWSPVLGGVSSLEEGEFRALPPGKMANGTGGDAGAEGRRVGGEGTDVGNRMHGEEGGFNAGGEMVNEDIFEGSFEPYAQGYDLSRKRKRRRANKSPMATQDQTGLKSQTGNGPSQEQVGQDAQTNDGQSNEQNGPVVDGNVQQEGGETEDRTGGNTQSDQGVESGEVNENPEMDIDRDNNDSSGPQDAVQEEVNETIQTGQSIGIHLKDFRKEVEDLVSGDGVFEV